MNTRENTLLFFTFAIEERVALKSDNPLFCDVDFPNLQEKGI
ncbi:MAG: hypothetical protein RBG13Loki_0557 [Promethearchaeota archaeon CR_4]|nr:MAG: hypothetical protein RBG13Loki_0557 [Candidatus Lokiarchaeota archaeon CR_4]